MTPSRADPRPGAQLAGRRIERLLGRGGLGSVYLGREASGCEVALKVIDLGAGAGPELRRLFGREVGLSRQLNHPGIVRILDAGEEGDLAFIVMELVAGGDLDHRRLHGRSLPARQAVHIAAQVAHALAHAHERGIVHRDVKPANILVDDATDQVKLADFGLARLADMQRSRTGVLAGTPAYMSPEQLTEAAQDGRADLYSLGVVLFQLLTGHLPHEAPSLGALLRRVSREVAPPLQQWWPQAPPVLSDLVAALLERERERRPPDAATLAARLEALLDAMPVDAPPRAPTRPIA